MKHGNLNGEMAYVLAGLTAPLTEVERGRQVARDGAEAPKVAPGRLGETLQPLAGAAAEESEAIIPDTVWV